MTVSSHRLVDRRTVRGALALAAAAPSVRNSQPWRWEVGRDAVHLHADLARWLPAADPMGRDLVMSCGAALHHARVALAATGLACSVQRMPDLDTPTHLATLRLHPRAAEATDLALAAAVLRRRTDRRPFADWEVPGEFVDELCERAAEQGAALRPVTAPRARQRLLRAIAEAARMPEGKDDDLLPEATDPEYEAVAGLPDGAVLTVLATASEGPLAHLRAGEALSAVLLHATELGLATCPMSRPLANGAGSVIAWDDVFAGGAAPQLVIRVGWAPLGAPPQPTSRRRIDELIDEPGR
jgi:nitroreductase